MQTERRRIVIRCWKKEGKAIENSKTADILKRRNFNVRE
jgi:hypothetical protein